MWAVLGWITKAARGRYNETNKLPSGSDLDRILSETGLEKIELMLRMGHLSREIRSSIMGNAEQIAKLISPVKDEKTTPKRTPPVFRTKLGSLYQCDCLDLMETMENDSIDLVFADPPFNLNKLYPSKINDNLKSEEYLNWCEKWALECARILKHNELSINLLDRIIEMASNKGDLIFDPFGGSGTTYAVAEIKGRRWIGTEIGPVETIAERFNHIHEDQENLNRIRKDINALIHKYYHKRVEKGLWTPDSFREKAS